VVHFKETIHGRVVFPTLNTTQSMQHTYS